MLQQTTVKAVIPYFQSFVAACPTVSALAGTPRDDVLKAWAGLGYYARARNLHRCAEIVATEHDGAFPQTEGALKQLPGIGDYTAAAIAAIAFGAPAAVVDGNVERVIARAYAIDTPLPKAKVAIKDRVAGLVPAERPGDFAQAMMDLGATICTPKTPSCLLCPWSGTCAANAAGQQTAFPVKAGKKARPLRRGHAYFVRDGSGRVLVRKRPDKGLLGGMTEIPTSPWREDDIAAEAQQPVAATYKRVPGLVRHVFTHFELELTVHVARADGAAPVEGYWVDEDQLDGEALPSVMRKVVAHARAVGA